MVRTRAGSGAPPGLPKGAAAAVAAAHASTPAASDLVTRSSYAYTRGRSTRTEDALEQTATRLWKRMGRDERLAAARHFFAEPAPELLGSAIAALVKARHLRPQVARAMAAEEQAKALAAVSDPGESLASGLVVALHLAERREIL